MCPNSLDWQPFRIKAKLDLNGTTSEWSTNTAQQTPLEGGPHYLQTLKTKTCFQLRLSSEDPSWVLASQCCPALTSNTSQRFSFTLSLLTSTRNSILWVFVFLFFTLMSWGCSRGRKPAVQFFSRLQKVTPPSFSSTRDNTQWRKALLNIWKVEKSKKI